MWPCEANGVIKSNSSESGRCSSNPGQLYCGRTGQYWGKCSGNLMFCQLGKDEEEQYSAVFFHAMQCNSSLQLCKGKHKWGVQGPAIRSTIVLPRQAMVLLLGTACPASVLLWGKRIPFALGWLNYGYIHYWKQTQKDITSYCRM